MQDFGTSRISAPPPPHRAGKSRPPPGAGAMIFNSCRINTINAALPTCFFQNLKCHVIIACVLKCMCGSRRFALRSRTSDARSSPVSPLQLFQHPNVS